MRLVFLLFTLSLALMPDAALAADEAPAHFGFLSVMPPILAIAMALAFRQVLPALFAGIWFGAFAMNGADLMAVWTGLLDTMQVYVVQGLNDPDRLSILVFTGLIGGMVGIISRAGGMQGVVEYIVLFATTQRRTQIGTATMGLAIFFDDYANTLVVGNTMRPVADRMKVSREKLAYIVDSTAAPVACIALVTTWIGYEVGLIGAAVEGMAGVPAPYIIFLNSLAYSFYPILALIFVFMIAGSGRDFGPMLTAERNARVNGGPGSEHAVGADMEDVAPKPGVTPRAITAVLPILVLLGSVIGGILVTGGGEGKELRDIVGDADSYIALVWGSLLGCLTAVLLSFGTGALNLGEITDAMVNGVKAMLLALMILTLAWALGDVATELGTALYLVEQLGDSIPAAILPTLIFVLAAATAFATGTSWGTMGILMPLTVPLTYAIISVDGAIDPASLPIFYSAISCVLAGAVWGDHCSPISDTTILSSLASGCDHVAHVRTQIPYALLVAGVGILAGTLPVGFGMPWWLGLVIGVSALGLTLKVFGRHAD